MNMSGLGTNVVSNTLTGSRTATSSVQLDQIGLIHAIAFSPHPQSASLLAVGGGNRVLVTELIAANPPLRSLQHFHHGTRVTAIGWSPLSSLTTDATPRLVFCTGGADYKIRIFDSDVVSNSNVQELEGHTGFVNAVNFDNRDGSFVVSTGDDATARVWDVASGLQHACVSLSSPGTAVLWHPKDSLHDLSLESSLEYMVAERGGKIRIMHAKRNSPIKTLQTEKSPLLDADWCATDANMIGAVANGYWVCWNREESSVEQSAIKLEIDNPSRFKWSSVSHNKFAIAGPTQVQAHIHDPVKTPNKTSVVASAQGQCTSVSWSSAEQTCCFAVGSTLHFVTL